MEAILVRIEGVKKATIDFEAKRASVAYNAGKTNPDKVVAQFNKNDSGYKATVVQQKKK